MVLCLLLIGMTACGSAPEAGQSTDPETSTDNEAVVVTTPDMTEEKSEPVLTAQRCDSGRYCA